MLPGHAYAVVHTVAVGPTLPADGAKGPRDDAPQGGATHSVRLLGLYNPVRRGAGQRRGGSFLALTHAAADSRVAAPPIWPVAVGRGVPVGPWVGG